VRGKAARQKPAMRQERHIGRAFGTDVAAMNLAYSRVGRTAHEQLRWVVDHFAGRDLSTARPEELIAVGYDLRVLGVRGWQGERDVGPMSETDVRARQREIAEGLRSYLTAGSWKGLPAPKAVFLLRGATGRGQRVWHGDERQMIVNAVAELLVQAGDRLRFCAESNCGRPFFAVKRQAYCSVRCSQKTRDRRKRARE
jgi:hypothetical protein